MITIDSASGYIDIPKVNTYEEFIDKLKEVLQINDDLFQHLYFSYIDEEEQERVRLIPQIYDEFINQENSKVSIGFLDNLNDEILGQFNDIIEKNKKRFKDPEFISGLQAKSDSDKNVIIIQEVKYEDEKENIEPIKEEVKEEVKEENKEEDKEDVIQEIKVIEEVKENPIEEVKDNVIEEIKENENENKNDETQSIIFAPYNSFVNGQNSYLDSNIEFESSILQFDSKTISLNKKYELNNNWEIDNGKKVDPELLVNKPNNQEVILVEQNNNINDDNLNIEKKDSDNCFNLFSHESNNNDNINSNEKKNNEEKNDSDQIFNSELNLKCFNDEFSNQINALEESLKNSNNEEYQKMNEENNFENNVKKIIESNVENAKKEILNSILLETSKIVSKSKLNQKNIFTLPLF